MTSHPRRRDLGVDAARGLALISMFVAHTAPSDGPGKLLYLSEFLTAPLFATLIGMGTWLGWSRLDGRAHHAHRRFLAGAAVRAVALIGIGLLLERLSTQVVIVLVHLGLVTLLVALLVRLSSTIVAALGISFVLLGSILMSALAPLYSQLATEGHPTLARLLDIAAIGPGSYRVTHLLAWACLGIILARRFQLTDGVLGSRLRDRKDGRTAWQLVRGDTLVAAGALVLAAAMLAPRSAGLFTMVAYQGSVPEVVFDALLCTVAVCGAAALVRLLPHSVVRPIAVAGAMTLTLYAAQILVLAAFTAAHPDGWRDDSWPMLFGLVIGSLAFAVLWRAGVRTGVFVRGPLEGVVGLGLRAVQKALPDRAQQAGYPASESSSRA